MTKILEQIQKENRKFILYQFEQSLLEANYGTFEEALNNTNLSIYIKENYSFLPLTLSKVLLAFKNKEVKTCYQNEIIFNIVGSQFCGLKLEDEFHNSHYSLYGICRWNLELETLEEQSEETQTKINELFTKDS